MGQRKGERRKESSLLGVVKVGRYRWGTGPPERKFILDPEIESDAGVELNRRRKEKGEIADLRRIGTSENTVRRRGSYLEGP